MRRRSCVALVIATTLLSGAIAAAASAAPGHEPSAGSAASGVTYGSFTGLVPLAQACGSRSPVYAVGAMSQAKALGVKQVRCDLSWWTVQPNNATSYDWTEYDNVVNAAAHYKIRVMFTVGFTPPWARPKQLPSGTTDPSHVPPANTADFVRFITAAVGRYAPHGPARVPSVVGSVYAWEIWNEPNIPSGWTPVDPVRYGTFLGTVATTIHHIDHYANVLSGGMAIATTSSDRLSPQDFLTRMAPTGALRQINGVGMHPYVFPAYPYEQVDSNPFYGVVPQLYQAMVASRIGGKKIWATEIGWPTSSQSWRTFRAADNINVGTEAYQAYEIPATLITWFTARYAGPAFIYAERDRCADNTNWLCKMGLERLDGSSKPAWKTIQNTLALPMQ